MRLPFSDRRARLIACGAIVLGFGACSRSGPATTTSTGPVGVTLQVVRADMLRDVANASGTIVPSAAGDWIVYAPEGARIAEITKKENDPVATGDLLVRFDIASLTQQVDARTLDVAEATSKVEKNKLEVARLQELFDRGLTARNTLEASRGELATSQSILNQLTTQLETIKAEESTTAIRARFPGTVVKVWHAQGDFVSGNTDPVLEVLDPSRVQVAVQLPVAQLARIVPGQTASVRAIAGDVDLPAIVVLKPSTTDPNAPTGEVRIGFSEPAALAVGAPVSVEILLEQRTGAIIVPVNAVVKDEAVSYVMVAGDDAHAHRRDVRTGLVTKDFAQIISGLMPGEKVIVGGLTEVSDGAPIVFTK